MLVLMAQTGELLGLYTILKIKTLAAVSQDKKLSYR